MVPSSGNVAIHKATVGGEVRRIRVAGINEN